MASRKPKQEVRRSVNAAALVRVERDLPDRAPERGGSADSTDSAARPTPGALAACGALLLLVSGIIYSPAWAGEFIWDDVDIYIVNNRLLRVPDGIYRFWFTNEPSDYYPLTYTTFWIEWQIAGDDPRLYHATNLILHAICGMVLYPLLRRLKVPGATLVCLWFVVHPLQVESVAWICQRKTILGALFGFAAAAEYIGDRQQGSRWAHLRSLVWFTLSLSAKPTLIMLPVLLAAYEACCHRDQWRNSIRRLGPLFMLSLLFGFIGTVYQQKLIGGVDVRHQDLAARLASMGWSAWFYIGQTARVGSLSFVYPRWIVNGWSLWSWLPNCAVVAATAILWKKRTAWGALPFGAWLAYLMTMLPVLGIADVFFWRYSYVGDHYVYQSLPAILSVASWAGSRAASSMRRGTLVCGTAGIVVAVLLGLASFQRAHVYQTEAGLWRETLQKNPRAALAWSGLGVLESRAGQSYSSLLKFQRAVALDPSLFEAWSNLGEIYRTDLNWPSALDAYERVLAVAPRGSDYYRTARTGLAAALLQFDRAERCIALTDQALPDLASCLTQPNGRRWEGTLGRTWVYRQAAFERAGDLHETAEAQQSLRELLESSPEVGPDVATAYEEVGRNELAFELWNRCVQKSPSDPAVLLPAGRVAVQIGRFALALELLGRAAAQSPHNVAILSQLAIAQISSGHIAEATESFRKAALLAPEDPRQHLNLALVLATSGGYAEAEGAFRRAAELDPANASILRDLAWLLATSPLADDLDKAQDALGFARRACQLTPTEPPEVLDALAASQAACGNFDGALTTIDRAIAALKSSGIESDRLTALQQRRELYRNRQAYREPLP